jgi:hypothetical protein
MTKIKFFSLHLFSRRTFVILSAIGTLAIISASFFVFGEFFGFTARAEEVTVKLTPPSETYATSNITTSRKATGLLISGGIYRSAIKFAIANIPAGATITKVEFFGYPGYCNSANTVDLDIYELTNDPTLSATTYQTLWSDARDGHNYVADSKVLQTGSGCKTTAYSPAIDLGAQAIADLQSAINSGKNWFGLGLSSDNTVSYGFFNAYSTANKNPYLNVTYTTNSNSAPTITNFSFSPATSTPGQIINFSANWSDVSSSEQAKLLVCKTNAIANGVCSGGARCDSSSFSTTKPAVCPYTVKEEDLGANQFYAFVCDDENACSASQTGSFRIEQGPVGIYEDANKNVGIGTTTPSKKLQVEGDFKLNGRMVSDGDICIGECGN